MVVAVLAQADVVERPANITGATVHKNHPRRSESRVDTETNGAQLPSNPSQSNEIEGKCVNGQVSRTAISLVYHGKSA
jgi:hypothetical protein